MDDDITKAKKRIDAIKSELEQLSIILSSKQKKGSFRFIMISRISLLPSLISMSQL